MLSFVYPLFWPLVNLYAVAAGTAKPFANVAKGTFGFFEHLVSIL
jgi:hypothetical protein